MDPGIYRNRRHAGAELAARLAHLAGRTDVVILDAQDFTGAPVATVHLPVRVPFGFHGSWVPDV